jgi:hypothetical protein
VGRTQELAVLAKRLDRVARDGRGVTVTIRGRRQVGKSRLVQEFIDRAGPPYFFFTATKQMPSPESSLPPRPELIIRESLELAAASGALPWPDVEAVGGWWNRRFDPEIDLVGADTAPVARSILFAGSVKWHASPVDARDVAALRRAAPSTPGIDLERCGYVVASLCGRQDHTDPDSADVWWGPGEVISAWA